MRISIILLVIFAVHCFVPTCRAVLGRCSTIKLPNGRVRGRARMRGRIVRFICNDGFTLVGNKYATCIKGEWDTPTPVCVNSECPIPPVPEHAVSASKYNGAIQIYFCESGYLLVGTPEIYCDGKHWNGTTPYCRDTKAAAPTQCDFEKPDLCWWEQDPDHDFDWKRHNLETPSYHIGTGPTHDHTLGEGYDGYYLYIEASGRLVNDTARIRSPLYNASLSESGCFSFWYHMYGATIGMLRIYFVEEFSGSQQLMFTKEGNQGNLWHHGLFDLPTSPTDFQIIIEGVRGSSYVSDIAIDDVAILQGDNCTLSKIEQATVVPNNDDQVEIINAQLTCRDKCVSTLTNETTPMPLSPRCLCTADCAEYSLCCPDFAQYCVLALPDDAYVTEGGTAKPYYTTIIPTTRAKKNESDIVIIKPPFAGISINPKDDIDPITYTRSPPTNVTVKTKTKAPPKLTTRKMTTMAPKKDIHTKETPFVPPTVTNGLINSANETGTGTRLQDPEKLHTASSMDVPSIVEMVAGILVVVCTLSAIIVLIIKRRKSYKRGSKGSTLSEDSDVRFLTSDEILDFTLARPNDNDES